MRLFLGLPFQKPDRLAFQTVQARLRQRAAKGNFTALENFHLTLAFLGQIPEERVDAALSALAEAPVPPMDLTFSTLAEFDGGVWYLSPQPCPPLARAQAALCRSLVRAGFQLEERTYTPHVTLGRKITLEEGFDPAGMTFRPIAARSGPGALFLSHRTDGALRYTPYPW